QKRWRGLSSNWADLENFTRAVQLLQKEIHEMIYPAGVLEFLCQANQDVLDQYGKNTDAIAEYSESLRGSILKILESLEFNETGRFGASGFLIKQTFNTLKTNFKT